MKLIIDIDENDYEKMKNGYIPSTFNTFSVIKNGTPIPETATNGEVIKAMFPNTEVDDYDYGKDPVIDVYGIDDTEYITLRKAWWNSPYQKSERR